MKDRHGRTLEAGNLAWKDSYKRRNGQFVEGTAIEIESITVRHGQSPSAGDYCESCGQREVARYRSEQELWCACGCILTRLTPDSQFIDEEISRFVKEIEDCDFMWLSP